MKKIVVIGSLNVDIVVNVETIPRPGETVLADQAAEFFGGKGANQAYAVARAGGNVAMIGKVGDDDYGKRVINNLNQVGVDTSHVFIDKDCATGYAFITVDKKAENSIVVVKGANQKLSVDDIKSAYELIDACDIILIQQEIPRQTIEYAIQLGYEKGKYIILNPAPVQELDEKVLGMVSLITPNRTELTILLKKNIENTEDSIEENIHNLTNKGSYEIIVTLGSKGVTYCKDNVIKPFKSYPVEAIDTTGAGDCFNGYLAANIAKELSMEQAIDMAQKAAAISVTKLGAQTSIPKMEDL